MPIDLINRVIRSTLQMSALVMLGWLPLAAGGESRENAIQEFLERVGTIAPESLVQQGFVQQELERPKDLQEAMDAQTLSRRVQAVVAEPMLNSSKANDDPAGKLGKDEALLRDALELYALRDFHTAIPAFVKVLNYEDVKPEVEQQSLLYLAAIYYHLDLPLRSIALLELYADRFRRAANREEIIFQVGKIHLELGQHDAAIATFYRVLNAIVLAGKEQMDNYLELARKAQFEIARTHFDRAEWVQAQELFQRILVFDLTEDDLETLRYYQARALIFSGRRLDGIHAIGKFLSDYPESPFLAELRYEKARAQIAMNQVELGRGGLIELLEMGGVPDPAKPDEFGNWRRIAGNFLANYHYRQGKYEVALRLYQAIVVMDPSPQWQLPIIMQMASCFRNLEQLDRAIESLAFVVQEVRGMRERTGGSPLSPNLEFLENSASWQLGLLRWKNEFVARLNPEPPLN